MKLYKIVIIWIFLIFNTTMLLSQSSFYSEYGKNRIQHKSLKWSIIYTDNFEIYYNNSGKNIADIASKHLENKFREITTSVGHQPIKKTKIFIFNSPNELIQSNIGINKKDIFLSTNLIQNNTIQFEIAFSENKNQFVKNLEYKLLNVIINDLMKGNNGFTKRFGKASFSSIPNWFIDGAAKYLAYGWNMEMDNVIRDYFLTQDLKKVKKITDQNSGIIGQSIWNYISIVYGKNIISNILNLTKIIRNPEKGISSTLGKNFNEIMKDWQNYYLSSVNKNSDQYTQLDNNQIIKLKKKYSNVSNIKISPNNNKILFSSNTKNGIKIFFLNLVTNKVTKISQMNNKSNSNSFYISWVNDDKIGYMKIINGLNNLVIYDLINKEKFYKSLARFENINGFSFNHTTNLIALSGTINSNSNIYLLSTYKNSTKQLTNDIADDIYPEFFPKSNSIIFSSNRTHVKLDSEINDLNDYYNLFIYNLDSTTSSLHQVTKTISNDIKSIPISKNEIIYLSDLKGINNIYNYNITNNTFSQFSDFYSNIINYDYNYQEKSLVLSFLKEGKINTYNIDEYNPKPIFSPKTDRLIYLERKKLNEKKIDFEIKSQKEKKIDFEKTENFEFKDDNKKTSSILNNINNFQNRTKLSGPINYNYSLVKNNFNSFIKIDPLEGYGSQIETDFIDILEDHKLYAKAFVPFSSIKSSDIYTEYTYLKKRIDFKLSYNRKIYFAEDQENFLYHKYSLNGFKIKAMYPLSNFVRLEIAPFFTRTEFSDLDYRVLNNTPPPFLYYNRTNYTGYTSNIIYDNSTKIGMNLEEGTKLKISYNNYFSLNNDLKDFNNLSIDLIHHQKISNHIILSSRVFYGGSFGDNPNKYILGGVQNSIFSSTNEDTPNNPLAIASGVDNSTILFSKFVDLRGYDFNKFNGKKVLLLSSELRIPLVKTLFNNEVSSEFLNNFQLIGFFDLGSSWDENSPFSIQSDVNTWIIKEPGSVFQAEIENSKNPWLASYGFGIRSLITDYYIKLDIAKPIEDYTTGKTKIHFSIGYSF